MRVLQVVELSGAAGLRLAEGPEPSGPGVLVDVHSVGVRYADLLRSKGLYQERSEPPYVPCNEVAGVVVRAPAGSGFKSGDRVAGMVDAAAAERVLADPERLYRLPASLSFVRGAGIVLNYLTAIFGLELRGRIRPGESVLVHGAAGGTGTAAIQVARALGGRVIAVVSSDEKASIAREAGAGDVVRSDGPWRDEALRLTDGRGVDVVWDPVGGDRVLDTLRVLAPLGRWVVIGFVGGPIPQVPLNRVLLKNVDVVGAYFSGYSAANPAVRQRLRERLQTMITGGAVAPIAGSVFPLADGASAFRALEQRSALGKVVINVR